MNRAIAATAAFAISSDIDRRRREQVNKLMARFLARNSFPIQIFRASLKPTESSLKESNGASPPPSTRYERYVIHVYSRSWKIDGKHATRLPLLAFNTNERISRDLALSEDDILLIGAGIKRCPLPAFRRKRPAAVQSALSTDRGVTRRARETLP